MSEVTLRDYIDTRFMELEKKLALQSDLNDRAIQKAEESLKIRLEAMNEFRKQIEKERQSYMTRDIYEANLKSVDERVKRLEISNAFSSGKLWMVMAGFTLVPVIIGIVALVK